MSVDVTLLSDTDDVTFVEDKYENANESTDSFADLCDVLVKPFSPLSLPSVSSGIFSECSTIVSSSGFSLSSFHKKHMCPGPTYKTQKFLGRLSHTNDIGLVIESLTGAAIRNLNAVSDFEGDCDIEEVKGRLVDFGCNEGKFLLRARHRLPSIENLIGVDLDAEVLSRAALNLDPDNGAISISERALRFKLFYGDISRYDRRLEMADAVVAIELCEKIALKYPEYNVKFSGVGEPPNDRKEIGFCTQIAIFRTKRDYYVDSKRIKRQNRLKINNRFGDKNFIEEKDETDDDFLDVKPYKLLYDIKYPNLPSATRIERIHCDARNFCEKLKREYHLPDEYYGGRCGNWYSFISLMENRSIRKRVKNEYDLIRICDQTGITNRWSSHADADCGYGLIGGGGSCRRIHPRIRCLFGG
uniref:Small RNA 2'-O-methyltransferase n=1 Tax=Romanomermis culicivorax TaxID=13658 RepID=A0A915JIM7_ROMCU